MKILMELPLPEVGRKVAWWAAKEGRIQAPSALLLLPDRACLLTTCSSDESEKKFLLIDNLELAITSPCLKIHCVSFLFLNVSASV